MQSRADTTPGVFQPVAELRRERICVKVLLISIGEIQNIVRQNHVGG